jgi:hypothetical protein
MFSRRKVSSGTLKIPSGYNKTFQRLTEILFLLYFMLSGTVCWSHSQQTYPVTGTCVENYTAKVRYSCAHSVTETDLETHFENIWSPETRLKSDRPLFLLLNPIWKYCYSIKVTGLALGVWLLLKLLLYIWGYFLRNTADALAATR